MATPVSGTASRLRIKLVAWPASSELPPSASKSASTSNGSGSFRSSAHTAATERSSSFRGSVMLLPLPPACAPLRLAPGGGALGSARRSSLPFDPRGM
eukprot:6321437-Prymnesium_polylepis.3